jgi:hypothetical protein
VRQEVSCELTTTAFAPGMAPAEVSTALYINGSMTSSSNFLFIDWEGISLVDVEKLRFLVSLAQHTGASSRSSTAEGFVTILSVSFGFFCP